MESNSETMLSKFLKNLSNYLLSATIICYVSGFAITNLYLGSLGVVNLDILRSRYILTGILFIIFFSAILYLLYGLRKIIVENEDKSWFDVLLKVANFSVPRIIIIYAIVPVIAIFAGSANRISPILPQSNSAISWDQWLSTEPLKNIQYTAVTILTLLIAVVSVFLIVGIIILVFNPKNKDGSRKSRKENLKILFTAPVKALIDSEKNIFLNLLTIIIVIYVVISLSSVFQLFQTSDITSSTSKESYLQVGWSRFFIAIVISYAFIASIVLMFSSLGNRNQVSKVDENKDKKESKDIIGDNFLMIYAIVPVIATIISVYAFGVYPYLPQQIGGGRLLPVVVNSSSADMDTIFTNQTNKTYLIDRAPKNSLFLIVDQTTEKYKIIEVSNDLLESIVFFESP